MAHSVHTHTQSHVQISYLSILLEVGPHASSISAPHEHVIGEEVDSRKRAGEFACGRLIVIPYICHHIIKLEYLTPLMLLAQTSIEGNFGAVEWWDVSPWAWTWRSRRTWLSWLSRWPTWAWWPWWPLVSTKTPRASSSASSVVGRRRRNRC